MRLLINYVSVLVFAVTGFFAFYLVIIDFIDHIDEANRPKLWFHIACSVLIAAGGAIVAWRRKIGAAVVLLCLLALVNIWLDYVDLPVNHTPSHELPESVPTIRKFFPAAYVGSFVLAIVQLVMPQKKVG